MVSSRATTALDFLDTFVCQREQNRSSRPLRTVPATRRLKVGLFKKFQSVFWWRGHDHDAVAADYLVTARIVCAKIRKDINELAGIVLLAVVGQQSY